MFGVQQVEAVTSEGPRGDRYLDPAPRRSPDSQVTLIEAENIEAVRIATGLPLGPEMPRRNVVTRHVRVNDPVGRRFAVGPVTLDGLELCEPCALFMQRTHQQTLNFFSREGRLTRRDRHRRHAGRRRLDRHSPLTTRGRTSSALPPGTVHRGRLSEGRSCGRAIP
jgi:hypothetical protein